nr:reverse transcriptase domain-containing protein [Tanacetum cinerariifolium]
CKLDELSPPIVMMADQRTMAQLPQASTEGYEDAIVVPAITADKFKLKHGLLTLVQNKQFFRHDKEDMHAHIRYFNKIASTLKFLNVPNTSIKLMLFLFSLEGASRIWLEKEPPRSIFTWDDLRFDESFSEAWDRFKDLLRACPHHGFSELHQLDTFYNALNSKDQDSLNSAAGDKPEATKDTVNPTNNESTEEVQPQVVSFESPVLTSKPITSPIYEPAITLVSASKSNPKTSIPYPSKRNDEWNREKANNQIEKFYRIFKDIKLADHLISHLVGVAEDVYAKVGSFHFPADFVVVDFDADPRVPLILERSFLKTEIALIDVFEGELTLRVGKEAITFNLDQTLRYSANYSDMTAK